MTRVEGWSTRDLRERIGSLLYERTALSEKPEALVRNELSALRDNGELSPALVFRDPYMLDFLDLADTYSEKDLESAILREIERFLLELGTGFAFVERQKRITRRRRLLSGPPVLPPAHAAPRCHRAEARRLQVC